MHSGLQHNGKVRVKQSVAWLDVRDLLFATIVRQSIVEPIDCVAGSFVWLIIANGDIIMLVDDVVVDIILANAFIVD